MSIEVYDILIDALSIAGNRVTHVYRSLRGLPEHYCDIIDMYEPRERSCCQSCNLGPSD